MADDFFGPPLPPGLKPTSSSCGVTAETSGSTKRKYSNSDSSSSASTSSSEDEAPKVQSVPVAGRLAVLGPALPPGLLGLSLPPELLGPSRPPGLLGPSRPPELLARPHAEPAIIGPVLPAHLASLAEVNRSEEENEEEEEAEGFGPMPSGREFSNAELAAREIEGRAERMKRKLLGEEDEVGEPKRDTWMLDLPPELVPNFGVTARKFRTKAPATGVDRSGWTDTPADRAKKEQAMQEGRMPIERKAVVNPVDVAQAKKDAEYAAQVAEYNKSVRAKSLLELRSEGKSEEKLGKSRSKKKKSKHKHKSEDKDKDNKHGDKKRKEHKKKKSKKEKEAVPERRPFDRDVDLQISRMDAAKRNSLIKSSHQLGGRFGHGSTQFL